MLSSEPEYPLEPNIVPLTYELNATQLAQSCWSCEGHADASGNLSRTPAIWFYAEHTVAVELLARHVQHLEDTRQLKHPWRISALIAGRMELDCPTFSLAPLVTIATSAGPPKNSSNPVGVLAELRRDLQLMSCSLGHRVRAQADKEIRQIRAELGA